jgi:cbb3-type cytochrome oxidase subunit 3
MKAEVLAGFEWIHLSIFALILFFLLFSGVIFWILRKDSNCVYSEASKLPLNEGGTR